MNSDSAVPAKAQTAVIEQWVPLPAGRVFVRRWQPAAARPGSAHALRAPLLMQHDSLGCVDLWRDLPRDLAEATGREVIAYDRLGFGRSDPRHGRPALGFVAEEVEQPLPRLLATLGVDRFIAFGHSVGGGMSVHSAAEGAGPWRCEALITIAAQAFVEDRTLSGIRAAERDFQVPGQMARLARYHGDKAAWVLDAWVGDWLDPAFATWTLDAVLPRVRCPVLVLHGEDDEYGSPAHPRRIAAGVTGPVSLHLLAGRGHMPHREDPATVVALVRDFLAALPA